jgi:hypothetical protein
MRELVKQYIELDKEIKLKENLKSKLKPKIEKFLRRCDRAGIKLNGISYKENERYKFNEDELYDWVWRQLNNEELFRTLTREVIDIEKLQQADSEGILDLSTLPSECYSITKYTTITVKKEK